MIDCDVMMLSTHDRSQLTDAGKVDLNGRTCATEGNQHSVRGRDRKVRDLDGRSNSGGNAEGCYAFWVR